VTAVAGSSAQPLVYYMGGTGGGVWKTADGGLTWLPVSDKVFTAGSVGALAVAPSDPNVVYAGTGESPIKVNNKLASLAGVVGSADAPLTDQSYQVFDQLAAELQGYLDRLKAIVETDVPAFNRTVREQDIPAVLGR
jgi:hypothetical protein